MFKIKKKINTPGIILDFYKTSDDLYIIIACFTQINIYKANDFSIFKEIKMPYNRKIEYDNLNIIDDNKIIFFGKKIGILTLSQDGPLQSQALA